MAMACKGKSKGKGKPKRSLVVQENLQEKRTLLSRDELEQEWLKKVKEVKGEKWLVEGAGQGGKSAAALRGKGRAVIAAKEGKRG